jgi:hypothetical protein
MRSSVEGNGEMRWNYCEHVGVEAESNPGGTAMEILLKGMTKDVQMNSRNFVKRTDGWQCYCYRLVAVHYR